MKNYKRSLELFQTLWRWAWWPGCSWMLQFVEIVGYYDYALLNGWKLRQEMKINHKERSSNSAPRHFVSILIYLVQSVRLVCTNNKILLLIQLSRWPRENGNVSNPIHRPKYSSMGTALTKTKEQLCRKKKSQSNTFIEVTFNVSFVMYEIWLMASVIINLSLSETPNLTFIQSLNWTLLNWITKTIFAHDLRSIP